MTRRDGEQKPAGGILQWQAVERLLQRRLNFERVDPFNYSCKGWPLYSLLVQQQGGKRWKSGENCQFWAHAAASIICSAATQSVAILMLPPRKNTCYHFGILFLSFSTCITNFCLKLYYIYAFWCETYFWEQYRQSCGDPARTELWVLHTVSSFHLWLKMP